MKKNYLKTKYRHEIIKTLRNIMRGQDYPKKIYKKIV
jgi:hypothetical protein